eukprot:TRINITY_DN7452_c0_g1_i6.p2 TRINITY_DN7452_c0_g1~~TRINITY_DN7452_c0_g1_i6.p2  ORF type:complete len:153 (+),score=1.20 TRINITY_DN7452_c0_g1_i6:64-522(+)
MCIRDSYYFGYEKKPENFTYLHGRIRGKEVNEIGMTIEDKIGLKRWYTYPFMMCWVSAFWALLLLTLSAIVQGWLEAIFVKLSFLGLYGCCVAIPWIFIGWFMVGKRMMACAKDFGESFLHARGINATGQALLLRIKLTLEDENVSEISRIS